MELLLIVGIFIVLAVGMGFLYEFVSDQRDRSRYAPPGKLVDVDGLRLHIHCMGDAGQKPTVILDSGFGGAGLLDWQLVQPEIATLTQVCAYDRAGYGWSERSKKPRDTDQLAQELHALLQAAEIAGPYILVGHSYAARHLRIFIERYPDEVVGMVMVDPGELAMVADDEKAGEIRRLNRIAFMKRFGLTRWIMPRVLRHIQRLPKENQHVYVAMNLRNHNTIADEAQALFFGEIEPPDSLGELPLIILSREPVEEVEDSQRRYALQKQRVGLSTNAQHITSESGGTYIHIEEPQLVIDAVRELVELARR